MGRLCHCQPTSVHYYGSKRKLIERWRTFEILQVPPKIWGCSFKYIGTTDSSYSKNCPLYNKKRTVSPPHGWLVFASFLIVHHRKTVGRWLASKDDRLICTHCGRPDTLRKCVVRFDWQTKKFNKKRLNARAHKVLSLLEGTTNQEFSSWIEDLDNALRSVKWNLLEKYGQFKQKNKNKNKTEKQISSTL